MLKRKLYEKLLRDILKNNDDMPIVVIQQMVYNSDIDLKTNKTLTGEIYTKDEKGIYRGKHFGKMLLKIADEDCKRETQAYYDKITKEKEV